MQHRALRGLAALTIGIGLLGGAAGCAAGGGPTTQGGSASASTSASASASSSPSAGSTSAADLDFAAGDGLPASLRVEWQQHLEADGWTADESRSDATTDRSAYTKGDAVLILQSGAVASVPLDQGDETATTSLLTLAGRTGDLHEQTLPRTGGGAVTFVGTLSQDTTGDTVLTVARVLAKPAIGLTLMLTVKDAGELHDQITAVAKDVSVTVG